MVAPPTDGQALPDTHSERPLWEAWEVSQAASPTMKFGAPRSWRISHLCRLSISSALILCWGFCGWLVVFYLTQSNRRQLKKKCQDKQNESLGDPVMGQSIECGNHSFDLCSDMFSICFCTECTFSPWIENNLNQGKTITKWPSNIMSVLELNDWSDI